MGPSPQALTQKPDVFIPKTLESGQKVTIFCVFTWTFKQCPVPSISWSGAALSSQETTPQTSYYSVLSLTPGPQDHDTELTCQVDFSRKDLSMKRTVRLSVACECAMALWGGLAERKAQHPGWWVPCYVVTCSLHRGHTFFSLREFLL